MGNSSRRHFLTFSSRKVDGMRAKLISLCLIVGLGLAAYGANCAWACPIPVVRFKFLVDPKTPERDLLPAPPKTPTRAPSLLLDDLLQIPEISLQEPLVGDPEARKVNFENLTEEQAEKLLRQIFQGKHKT